MVGESLKQKPIPDFRLSTNKKAVREMDSPFSFQVCKPNVLSTRRGRTFPPSTGGTWPWLLSPLGGQV